jgi:hypothetical protein
MAMEEYGGIVGMIEKTTNFLALVVSKEMKVAMLCSYPINRNLCDGSPIFKDRMTYYLSHLKNTELHILMPDMEDREFKKDNLYIHTIKRRKLLYIPYFLSITGVTYQIFGYPRQMALNSDTVEYNAEVVYDQESYSAKWLGDNIKPRNAMIYTDGILGSMRLKSQGMILEDFPHSLIEAEKIGRGCIFRIKMLMRREMVWKELCQTRDIRGIRC